ncbi:hypothetical protein ACFL02_08815 [Planctomycetota bacterium]
MVSRPVLQVKVCNITAGRLAFCFDRFSLMSRGLGKIQRAALEILQKTQKDDGWVEVRTLAQMIYDPDEKEYKHGSRYCNETWLSSTHRAIIQLEEKGLIVSGWCIRCYVCSFGSPAHGYCKYVQLPKKE